ncbi:hypothetical protein FACS1894211_02880 [Clostridia bacterium]|nr:hypothetical protein FACS1894211_02880 [Clostridia bacterium]
MEQIERKQNGIVTNGLGYSTAVLTLAAGDPTVRFIIIDGAIKIGTFFVQLFGG